MDEELKKAIIIETAKIMVKEGFELGKKCLPGILQKMKGMAQAGKDNLLAILGMAMDKLQRKGVTEPKEISQSNLFRLSMDCLAAEDSTLRELFANLLANELDPDGNGIHFLTYSDILRQMSPIDAKVLKILWEELADQFGGIKTGNLDALGEEGGEGVHDISGKGPQRAMSELAIDEGQLKRAMDNLVRLGIILPFRHIKIPSGYPKVEFGAFGGFFCQQVVDGTSPR